MKILSIIALFTTSLMYSLASAQADNIAVKYDIDINSANPADVDYIFPGTLVVGGKFLIGIQPDWSQYTGKLAAPGGMLLLTAFYGPDSFTPNGTATEELYGSTLDLSTGTASYNSFEATNPVDFGSLTLSADTAGDQITVTGSTALIAAFDAGEAGTIKTLFLGSPVGNLGENYVGGIGSGDDEVLNVPLIPSGVPEPSTWTMFGIVGIGFFAARRYRTGRIA